MSDTSLVFNLLAVDKASGVLGGLGVAFGSLKQGLVMGAVEMGVGMIKMAGDFQFGITRLETGAGEAHANLKMVSEGILNLAGSVGESTKALNAGMYLVESAGYHGADGLNVLRIAAEGAKVGNADMATVADAVTTALNAYGMGAGGAAAATNALIAAEGEGKTNLEALAGSLSTVAPIAATAHVSLNEVLAAMATMTAQGTPAANAATYLRQAIGQLSAPSGKAQQEMQSLGLSAITVSQNLGKNGLASTLDMLTNAIESKMGPAGTVLIEHLRKAAAGSTDFQKVLAALPADQQTYVGALAEMTGGVKSMQAALQLTGPHMKDFVANTQLINEKVKAGGQTIEGWSEVQKTFNQKMAEAKGQVEALSVRIGSALLPAATALLGKISELVGWLDKHRAAIQGVIASVGSVVGWFKEHKAITEALVITIGALVIVTKAHAAAMAMEKAGGFIAFLGEYLRSIKAVQIATKAWTAVQWLLDVAMDASPIGLVVIAIAALAAVFVYLWMHSAGFRNFWIGLWHDIVAIAKAVGEWFAGPFSNFFVALWHDLVSIWHGIAAFFVAAWHSVVDPIVHGWNELYHGTMVVFDAVVSFFRKWWPLLVVIFAPWLALLIAIWNHFHTQIIGTLVTIWNGVKAFWIAVFSALKAIALTDWQLIYNYIVKPIEAVYHWLDEKWQLIKLGATIAWQTLRNVAASVWAGINHAIVQPIEDAYNKAVAKFEALKSAITSKLDEAWNAVKSIGSKFASIGEAIVNGIISGVGSAAGALFDKLKGLANDALSSAKSFLGIHSPSRLFAEHVGAAIPAGVAMGVDTGTPMAVRAIHRMGEGLANTDVMSLGGSSGTHSRTSNAPSTMQMTGNVDGAFATALKRLIRTGQITFFDSTGQSVTVT